MTATTLHTATIEHEFNPMEAQAARFDLAAHKLNLDEGLWKVLRYSNREVTVHIPVAMDNGKLEVFTGFRAGDRVSDRERQGWRAFLTQSDSLCVGRVKRLPLDPPRIQREG